MTLERPSVIPQGVAVEGNLEGKGDVWIAGTVRGTVRIDGLVLIESTGSIEGDVTARAVVVRGTLIGDASGTEIVRIEVGSKMVGDARAPRVGVVEGALFRGQVHLGEDPSMLRIPRASRTTAAGTRAAARRSSAGTISASSISLTALGQDVPADRSTDPRTPRVEVSPPPLQMPKIGRQRGMRRDEV